MAMTVRKAEYYYAVFDDTSGVAAGLLELFQQKGVKINAFTAFPIGRDKAQIDFFPENPNALVGALGEVGITLTGPRYAFLIQGADDLRSIVKHHEALAEEGINVVAANGVTDCGGQFGYVLWVNSPDFEKAAEILGCGAGLVSGR